MSQLKPLESLHDSTTSSISIENTALILQFDDVVPPTPEMDEYQQQNGITHKVKATYYFPDQPDYPVEKDFWSARVQLVYYKKRIFRPRVESVTLSEFVETVNKRSTRKTTVYMEILHQFFNDRWYVIDGTLYGKRNNGKKFCIADTQLQFCCDKIEYDWETVKP